MPEENERFGGVEKRLDDMAGAIGALTKDVIGLKQDVTGLKQDVGALRVLYEHHDEQIRTIAEVQAHHGTQLEEHGKLLHEIRDELAPIRDLRDFVRRVAENHEARLSTLERHTGL